MKFIQHKETRIEIWHEEDGVFEGAYIGAINLNEFGVAHFRCNTGFIPLTTNELRQIATQMDQLEKEKQ